MKLYEFELILDSTIEAFGEEMADCLYEAGCDDSSVGIRNSVVSIEFAREADNAYDALTSAIQNVRQAGFDILCIEPDDYVKRAEIARRAGVQRETVNTWVKGKRKTTPFPRPVANTVSKSPIWSWAEIVEWLHQNGRGENTPGFELASPIAAVNQALCAARFTNSAQKLIARRILMAENKASR